MMHDLFGYVEELPVCNPTSHGNKHQGAAYVALFKYECLIRGWTPLEPEADADSYDLIVDTRKRMWRCQIKGTSQGLYKGSYKVIVGRGCESKEKHTSEEIDLVAIYVEKCSSWWIIPVTGEFPISVSLGRMFPEAKDNWKVLS